MKNCKIAGHKAFFVSKQEYLIVLNKNVKLYDKKFRCIKTYRNIKYASYVSYDGDKAYIGTTENLIYVICLVSLEIIKCYRIELNGLSMEPKIDFEIRQFLTIDGGTKLLITAVSLGAALILEFDIEKEQIRILKEDKDWCFDLYSLNRMSHGISLISTNGGIWREGADIKNFSLKKNNFENVPYLYFLEYEIKKTPFRKWWRRLHYVTSDEKYYLLGEKKHHFVIMNADNGMEFPLSENKNTFCSYRPTCKYNPDSKIMLVIESEEHRIHIVKIKSTEVVLKKTFLNFSDGVFFADREIILLAEDGESIIVEETDLME